MKLQIARQRSAYGYDISDFEVSLCLRIAVPLDDYLKRPSPS